MEFVVRTLLCLYRVGQYCNIRPTALIKASLWLRQALYTIAVTTAIITAILFQIPLFLSMTFKSYPVGISTVLYPPEAERNTQSVASTHIAHRAFILYGNLYALSMLYKQAVCVCGRR